LNGDQLSLELQCCDKAWRKPADFRPKYGLSRLKSLPSPSKFRYRFSYRIPTGTKIFKPDSDTQYFKIRFRIPDTKIEKSRRYPIPILTPDLMSFVHGKQKLNTCLFYHCHSFEFDIKASEQTRKNVNKIEPITS
jgi:hypothetical protein